MALQLQIIKTNGTESNYHRIVDSSLRVTDKKIFLSVELKSYLNKEYRDNGFHNDTHFYRFELTEGEDFNVGIRELGYTKLKELSEWKDAVDC